MSRLSSLFLVGFIQVKWLKNFLLLSMQIIIYSNFIEHEHETIIHIRLLVWHIKFEKPKVLKEDLNEKLVLITWYPKKWWNFCM